METMEKYSMIGFCNNFFNKLCFWTNLSLLFFNRSSLDKVSLILKKIKKHTIKIAATFPKNKTLIYRVYKNPATSDPIPKPRFNPKYINENTSFRFLGVLISTIIAS